MEWKSLRKGFENYLRLEKGLSKNSILAYRNDLRKLELFLSENENTTSPLRISHDVLAEFVHITAQDSQARTQARLISGIKAFFKYLNIEDYRSDDPSELLESPRIAQKLPDTLSIQEVDKMLNSIDLSKQEGIRNRAMLETLYSCGLRVSELVGMQISNVYDHEGFVRVVGKGNKERLVPIGRDAIKYIAMYRDQIRNHLNIASSQSDILFLNKHNRSLSRVMVFNIVKETAVKAGLRKVVSPHTFRHSFATHMVEMGADLRSVQEMLGHASITTTEIYTHLDRKYLRESIMKYHPRNTK